MGNKSSSESLPPPPSPNNAKAAANADKNAQRTAKADEREAKKALEAAIRDAKKEQNTADTKARKEQNTADKEARKAQNMAERVARKEQNTADRADAIETIEDQRKINAEVRENERSKLREAAEKLVEIDKVILKAYQEEQLNWSKQAILQINGTTLPDEEKKEQVELIKKEFKMRMAVKAYELEAERVSKIWKSNGGRIKTRRRNRKHKTIHRRKTKKKWVRTKNN